ncbi:cobalamin B12-binding domain-containing protein [Mycobacterium simiae]|uniref:Cobalamin B12-binding domain-containing protein n=2 Tax=Mycobacterium simiae TaxID=1784 RepID=A0A5B1BRG6_MYCSI|nr:cobalamin B12-binding domain-containing protein [Mycobacterium simiae]
MAGAFQCVLSTVESDAHMWNLVYLQKLLEEHGASVRNLGCCTPVAGVVEAVITEPTDLLVVSSINGHGFHGAKHLMGALREWGIAVPSVIGGKLTTAVADNFAVREQLLREGFTDVFLGADAILRFVEFISAGKNFGFGLWDAESRTAGERVVTSIRPTTFADV